MKETVESVLEGLTIDLGYDAVGLWQVYRSGTEAHGLSGEGLDDFLRTAIRHLTDQGAIPLRAHRRGWWLRQDQFGEGAETIAANVLDDWKNSGNEAPGVDGIWFGRTGVLDIE